MRIKKGHVYTQYYCVVVTLWVDFVATIKLSEF